MLKNTWCEHVIYCSYRCASTEHYNIHDPFCREFAARSLRVASSDMPRQQEEQPTLPPHGRLVKVVIRVRQWPNALIWDASKLSVLLPGMRREIWATPSNASELDATFSGLRAALGEHSRTSTQLLLVTVPDCFDLDEMHIGSAVSATYLCYVHRHAFTKYADNFGTIVGFIGETRHTERPELILGGLELYSGTVDAAGKEHRMQCQRRRWSGLHLLERRRQSWVQGVATENPYAETDAAKGLSLETGEYDRYWLFTAMLSGTFYIDTGSSAEVLVLPGCISSPPIFATEPLANMTPLHVLETIAARFFARRGRRGRTSDDLLRLTPADEHAHDSQQQEGDACDLCVVCSENRANVLFRPCAHGPVLCIGCSRMVQQRAHAAGMPFTCPVDRTVVTRTIILHGGQVAQPGKRVPRNHTIRQNDK